MAVDDRKINIWETRNLAHIEETVREKGSYEVYIGTLATDTGRFEHQQHGVQDQIDNLLRMFEIAPDTWEERVLKLRYSSRPWEKERFKEDIIQTKRDRSLGEFLIDSAAFDLNIEEVEDGLGGCELSYMLSPNLMATFSGSGDFWTTRQFIDPDTSQIMDDVNDSVRLAELEEKEGPVRFDSRADYQLQFKVCFSRPMT